MKTNSMMNIRAAKVEDVDQIRSMVLNLAHFYLSDNAVELPVWLSSALELQAFEMRLEDPEFIHFVCVQQSAVIGYIAIKNKNHIYHLFVSAQHQGQGIAKQLWQWAKQACGSVEYTVRSSLFAVPVYESFGFVKTEPLAIKDELQFQSMAMRISA